MKRRMALLLAAVLLLAALPACGQQSTEPDPPAPAEEPVYAARILADAALPSTGREDTLPLEYLNPEEDPERLAVYIESMCGLTAEQWEDAAVIRATGASAFEVVVLRLEDGASAARLEPVLTDYLTARQGAFTGYAPAEAEMAASGVIRREGRYVGLFICPDPEGAAAAFTAACAGELPPPPTAAEPEPEAAADDFTPMFDLHDLLHRLLLEAACPEWQDIDLRIWSEDGISGSATGNWIPDDGGEWSFGGLYQEDDEIWIGVEHMVSVFLCESEDAAEERAEGQREYLAEQEAWYTQHGYEDKAELVRQGRAVSAGRYAALIVSEHAEDAVLLFPRIVNDPNTGGYFDRYIQGLQSAAMPPSDPDPDYPDRVRFVPPGEDDMTVYDTSAILAAWERRDPSGLSEDDRATYDAAEQILAEIIREDMSDLEKETAIYRWLVENVDYDWTHQDVLAETSRHSYGPYGGLVNRAAVCLGYAASFQLLMDMSGVECTIVVGAAFQSRGDHAWNMVRLHDDWYCVDVTWDANAREQLGGEPEWRYFNLTSDEMARNHQWDYANTPEATAEDRGG